MIRKRELKSSLANSVPKNSGRDVQKAGSPRLQMKNEKVKSQKNEKMKKSYFSRLGPGRRFIAFHKKMYIKRRERL